MALKSKKLENVRGSLPVTIIEKENLVRVNLEVTATMRQDWKIAAAKHNLSLKEFIIQCVQNGIPQ